MANGTLPHATSLTHLRSSAAAFAFLLLLFAPQLLAQNWPQWRGPSSEGVSTESGGCRPVERHREHRLEGPARRTRCVLAHRVGRPCHSSLRRSASTPCRRRSHPLLARDDRSLADARGPIGGQRGACRLRAEATSPRCRGVPAVGRDALWEYRTEAHRPLPGAAREAQPRDADARHRRRAHLRLVRQRTDRRARHGRRRRLEAASRRRILAVSRRNGDTAARRRCTTTC